MEQKLTIGLSGASLSVIDKEEQTKIYRWFILTNEPTAFVKAIYTFKYAPNGDNKAQDFIINRSCVCFMTFED